jgi:cobyrinic acid a,c-diamide synthase
MLRDYVDIEALLTVARNAPDFLAFDMDETRAKAQAGPAVRIGVVRDEVLWQYYDENLDALRNAGAELVFVSLLDETPWPQLDGLYLGGGDLGPHAATLARNTARKNEITALIESGMPVYAEHSGYFYLGRTFSHGGADHHMAGIFPVRAAITEKPVRLGYMEAVLDTNTPFYPEGHSFKGHEYHYADITVSGKAVASLKKKAGGKLIEVINGLVYKAAFGTSMQIFAPVVPEWAVSFIRAARAWKNVP